MGKGQLGGAPSWFKKITDRIRRDISNSQGQNVITYPYYESSKTENGVQFSIRSDGTIKVNGTATADTYFILHNYLKGDSNDLTVPFGIYALSGCPKGGSSSTYFMQVTMSMAGSEYDIITDYGDGGIGDIDNEGDYITSTDAYIGIKFCVKSGTTVSDIIIKPMLEKGTASHEYQPTNISNRTLLSTKVDKVDGKQLSTEDFTTEEKKALGSLMKGSVTGVKGNAESSYRTGNVNLTPANIGALATNGDSKSNTVTFTSNDVDDASATSWTSVSKLATGITHATFFQRVSQMFKNVRYIYKMLGTTDISKIGNGTVTGALSSLNSNSVKKSGDTINGRLNVTNGTNAVEVFADGEGGSINLNNIPVNRAIQQDILNGAYRAYLYQINPWQYLNDITIHADKVTTQKDFVNGGGISLNSLNEKFNSYQKSGNYVKAQNHDIQLEWDEKGLMVIIDSTAVGYLAFKH